MPAVNVARTDTFEQQRVKINEIGTQIFTVTAGGSDLSTGNLKLGDGLVTAPSLAFVNDVSVGLYRNGTGVLGFAAGGKKLSDLAATSVKYYRDFLIEKNSLDTLGISITNAGQNYDGGQYTEIPAIGGTGDGATFGVTIDGFGGTITNTGTGYTPGVYLNIPVTTNGSGSGATIDFTVDQISGQITNGGINYYPGSYTNIAMTGGNGLQMTGDIVVSSFAATVTSGSNYPDGLYKSIPLTGGNGTGMLVNLYVNNGGVQPFGGVTSSEYVSTTTNYTVGDVLTGSIPLAGTQTFIVKSSLGNKYFIDGFLGGNFNLLKGKTYVFDCSDATNDPHPLFISTVDADQNTILDAADGVTYELDGATVTGAQFLSGYFGATTSRTITFAVPTNPATTSVWYGCSVHPLQGGELTFSDPNSQQGGFQLVVDTLGGTISEFIVNAPGDGNYQVGDVISVAASDLYDANSADAATPGSGLQITLGGNFGAIPALDKISLFGSGYATGEILTLASAVNNVATYARGELTFNGVTFSSNAGVTALQFTGIATGAAQTYSNILVSTISSNGSGLRVDVVKSVGGGNTSYSAVNIVAAGQGYLPGDTLYIPGNALGGAAGNQPGSGGNDLAITVDSIEAGSPQVTVSSTTGIEVGDGVELIQNINNTAQIPAGVTVASVDSATQFTMSAGPTQPGNADIKVVNQNQTYLTVPSSAGIVSGMIVVYVSGNGVIIAGSTVTGIIDATTVELSILPTTAGAMVVNFEPEYGGGTNFEYTINKLGFASEVTIVDGGNGYTIGDTLSANPTDLVQPEVYAVTNVTVDKVTFVSTLAAATFSVGDLVRDAGGGVVASTITTSTTVAAGANANYTAVTPSSTSGNGTGATFDVSRGAAGDVLSVVVTTGSEGAFFVANETATLPGASVGGSTPADNIVVTITNVSTAGTPAAITKVGTSGGNIAYIITDTFGFQAGQQLVKDSVPATGYEINTAASEFRYFIDINDGNGAVMTPSWTMYSGNSYTFDLSDASNGAHVFALSQFRDGQWAPSRNENISTTLSANSPSITVNSTTGIQPGMEVVKVSGDGILPDGTTVLTVVNGTTLTLSANPTTAGAIVVNIVGSKYTTGVTVDGTNHTIKVSDATPTLYYFCATDDPQHQNEGGDDNEEAAITINTNNPKTFGTGFEIAVTDVTVEEVVKGKVDDGEFSVQKLITPSAQITAADISNATVSATATLAATVTSSITAVAGENLAIAVTDPLTNTVAVDAAGFNIGSTIQIAATSGNVTASGEFKGASVSVGAVSYTHLTLPTKRIV